MLLNGLISDCTTKGSLMRSWYAEITVGPTGQVTGCTATGAGGLFVYKQWLQIRIWRKDHWEYGLQWDRLSGQPERRKSIGPDAGGSRDQQ